MEGNYFDCGTPEEYIKLLKETLLSWKIIIFRL
jgi:UTP-glucose-1-phosphate uridylyltransferase